MTPTSLDNQSGAADDTHIVRIVRLETQMDNVTSALISLQRTQESLQRTQESLQRTQEQNHLAMLAQLDALRTHIDKQIAGVNDRIDYVQRYTIDRLDSLDARITTRIDRVYYWMVAFTVTNFAALLGIVVRWTIG